jgi:hypothetical protein
MIFLRSEADQRRSINGSKDYAELLAAVTAVTTVTTGHLDITTTSA